MAPDRAARRELGRLSSVLLTPPARATVSYTFFLQQVWAKNVATVTSTGEMLQGSFTKPVSYTPEGGTAEQVDRFATQRPSFADARLFQQLQAAGVPVNANPPDEGSPLWQQLLLGFGPTLLLVWLLVSFTRRAGGAGGALGTFGRSRAMLYKPEEGARTTFADVAGIDEHRGVDRQQRPGRPRLDVLQHRVGDPRDGILAHRDRWKSLGAVSIETPPPRSPEEPL